MPSWKISVLSQAAEPGSRPPTSPWCAVVVAKPTSVSSRKTGLKTKMSWRWMPPSKGSFITNTSPGRSASPHFASRVSIACGTEPRWNGTVTACATVSPDGVAERGREVHPVADDGRVRGAEDRRRHLVGDRRERVADDLLRDRVDARGGARHRAPGRACRSPGSRRTVQPRRTTTVVSYSSTRSGPGSGCSPIEARRPHRHLARIGAGVDACELPPLGRSASASASRSTALDGPSPPSRSARISIGEPSSPRTP